jgi:glycosyltransferase involved in cell wall biosynthesis
MLNSVTTSLPRLSIVIPTYQQGGYIERTLQSIISQNYPQLQLIVIDGGSTDQTGEIIERYRQHISIYISEKDDGQSDAIRKGFDLACGDLITWMNSDDTYTEGALLAVGQFFVSNPSVRFAYGNRDVINENDQIIGRRRQPDFHPRVMRYCHMIVPQVSAFWQRSLYQESGGIDASLRFCMDFDLFVKMALISPPAHLPIILGNFRIHSDSKTSNLENVRLAEDQLVHERYCRFKPSTFQFMLARAYCQILLVLNMAKNGGLSDRIYERLSRFVGRNIYA